MAETKITEYLGTGRRKTAIARVRLASGTGKITVNGRQFENYFPLETLRATATQPLTVTGTAEKFECAHQCHRRRAQRPGRRGAARHRPRVAAIRRDPAGCVESRGLAHARFAHERAQEIRPAGRAQTLPILEALIALEISKPRWFNPAGFFV